MRSIHLLIILFASLVFCYCKKDTTSPVTATPTPIPFVEYRNSYIGNYKGYYVGYSQIQPYYFINIADSSSFRTDTITKDINNDSNIISKRFGTFKIKATGSYTYNSNGSYTNLYFRNDSMIYKKHSFYGANSPSSTSEAKLKKQ